MSGDVGRRPSPEGQDGRNRQPEKREDQGPSRGIETSQERLLRNMRNFWITPAPIPEDNPSSPSHLPDIPPQSESIHSLIQKFQNITQYEQLPKISKKQYDEINTYIDENAKREGMDTETIRSIQVAALNAYKRDYHPKGWSTISAADIKKSQAEKREKRRIDSGEAALEENREKLEENKLKIDKKGEELKHLLDIIKGDKKQAFYYAMCYSATSPISEAPRNFAKNNFEDYMKKFYDKAKIYKKERGSLLIEMNELNNNIRRHNDKITLFNEKMYKKKSERLQEVDRYEKSRLPGDFEHNYLSIEYVIGQRLWESTN